jgi:acetoin utilization protein AcuB
VEHTQSRKMRRPQGFSRRSLRFLRAWHGILEYHMKKELVRDWMSTDVVTVVPEVTLPEAHQLMTVEEVRRLPVVDGDGRLVGIVTIGDIRSAEPSPATTLSIWEMNYLLSSLPVEKIMTRQPRTITAEATIGEAARIMLEQRISGLPVVDAAHRVVGIITESDIFSMVVLHEWSQEHAERNPA